MGMSVYPLSYLENHVAELHHILYMLPIAVARSSADGVAVCYVLPVLWMTSCFFLLGSMVRHVHWYNVAIESGAAETASNEMIRR